MFQKSKMNFIGEFKGGKLYEGETLVFHTSTGESFSYKKELKDYILDWAMRPLQPNPEALDLIRGVYPISKYQYPVRCEFKDGTSSDYCVIEFRNFPPTEVEFNKSSKWAYFDAVSSVSISTKVVSNELARRLQAMHKNNKSLIKSILKLKGNLMDNPEYAKLQAEFKVVVVSDQSGGIYKFEEPETFLYENYLNANNLTIIEEPTQTQIERASLLSVNPLEYERREYIPPIPTKWVLADLP